MLTLGILAFLAVEICLVSSAETGQSDANYTINTISLWNGTNPSEGNLFLNDKPVCGGSKDYWGDNEAAVACRTLGYRFGFPTTRSRFGLVIPGGFSGYWEFVYVRCDGTEQSLNECRIHESSYGCANVLAAGVFCTNENSTLLPMFNATVVSPNHASNYPTNVSKCWIKMPRKGRRVELKFTAFNLPAQPSTDGDWITINPAINGKTKFWGESLSASTAPPSKHIFPPDQLVTICIKTGQHVANLLGFRAELTNRIDRTILTGASAAFTSPNYPSFYQEGVNNCWQKTPALGSAVKLSFSAFNVGYDIGNFGWQNLNQAFITINPPINGTKQFWGNKLNVSTSPPANHIFRMDQRVTVCFKTRYHFNLGPNFRHTGFVAEMSDATPPGKATTAFSTNTVFLTSLFTTSSPSSIPTSCGRRNKQPIMSKLKVKKAKTALACQQLCSNCNGCTHFMWKKHKRACTLQKVGYKKKKNFVSGPVTC